MRFISLFSGIEAASCAWLPLGWECVAVAEIEPFPCKVLAHHYPEVPNLGDITKITEAQIKALGHIDLVVGGFPCQDLSVAGKRKGLKNEDGSSTRSGLFYDAMRIVRWAGVRYCLLENVPGIYSSNRGRDFAAVVGEILGVQFGVPANGWENTGVAASDRGLLEWATLDAQWFGVAQRRRRMFALADFGDWRSRGPVLFESHSLSGNPAPRRESREVASYGFADSAGGGIAKPLGAHALSKGRGTDLDNSTYVAHTLRASGFDASEDGSGRGTPLVPVAEPYTLAIRGRGGENALEFRQDGTANALLTPNGGRGGIGVGAIAFSCKDHGADAGEVAPTLRSMGHDGSHANGGGQVAVAFAHQAGGTQTTLGFDPDSDTAPTLAKCQTPAVQARMAVRRLTPVECSRLQGFPDDYLELSYANADEAHAAQVLHELWREAGAPAAQGQGWGTGVVASLLTPEILLAGVHVGWLSWEMAAGCAAARGALSGEKHNHEGFVRALRSAGNAGCSSFRRESFEQLARELGSYLPLLPLEGAQARSVLRGSRLWPEAQARWPLRYAFSAAKEGRSDKPLTPDGPRYKALGNSMCVNVMFWLGKRIQAVAAQS